MGVAHQKPARRETFDDIGKLGCLHANVAASARNAIDHTAAIRVGLQPSHAPEAGVAKRALVEIHRVLSGE
jgi:hypothetical protein